MPWRRTASMAEAAAGTEPAVTTATSAPAPSVSSLTWSVTEPGHRVDGGEGAELAGPAAPLFVRLADAMTMAPSCLASTRCSRPMGPAPTSSIVVPAPTPSSSSELSTQDVGSSSDAWGSDRPFGQLEDVAHVDDRLRHDDVLAEAAVLFVAQGDALGAAVALADAAELADAAGDDGAQRDGLALGVAFDAVAEAGDDAGDLVAGDDAGLHVLLALVDSAGRSSRGR